MKAILIFNRLFTRGMLKGMNVPDKMTHVDRWHAAQWLKGIRRNTRKNRLDYKINKVIVLD